MPKRFTVTEKWQDPWLHGRSPTAKLLWIYLCDSCDIAGFWEIDIKRAGFDTGIRKRGIEGALEELARGFERNGRFIWLRNFLKYQGNLPLNENNPAHRGIIKLLNERKSFSDNILLILEGKELKGPSKGLDSPISISKGKGKGKGKGKIFIPPSLEEVKQYIQDNPELNNVDPNTFWKGFNDGGWIDTKGNAVRNWKLKLRTWSNYGSSKKQRTTNKRNNYAEQQSEYGETIET